MEDHLVEQGSQTELGKYPAPAKGVQRIVDAENGELTGGANGVDLLAVDGNAGATVVLMDGDQGSCREVLLENDLNFLCVPLRLYRWSL